MAEAKPRSSARRRVEIAAGGRCEYCKSPAAYSPDYFEMDHIVPQAAGGLTVFANLAFPCGGCNNRKDVHTESTDPITGEVVPLFHPRQSAWHEHFGWSENLLEVVAKTPEATVTIRLLELNRPELLRLRRLLLYDGQHPPVADE